MSSIAESIYRPITKLKCGLSLPDETIAVLIKHSESFTDFLF